MAFKLPYTGRSIKYYIVPVVSSVVLGSFEGGLPVRKWQKLIHSARHICKIKYNTSCKHKKQLNSSVEKRPK